MKNNKAYFLDTEEDVLYSLTAAKKKKLEKQHPEWLHYNSDDNYEQLQDVLNFFKENGTLLACPQFHNIFVGLTA